MNIARSIFALIVFTALLVTGCAQKAVQQTGMPTMHDLSGKVSSGEYVKKIDKFLLIFDGSSSMAEESQDVRKFDSAMAVANSMNNMIPDMQIQAGLRVFGPNVIEWKGYNTLTYGMTGYTTAGLYKALAQVKAPAGTTPLGDAMAMAGNDLKGAAGKSALIIISDGETEAAAALSAAAALNQQFGGNLCVYPIVIGNSAAGQSLFKKITQTTGCGFVSNGSQLLAGDAMADFVTKVFFEHTPDSDSDGVIDSKDRCPNTPKGIAVDASGCPKDTDGDGVYDSLDKCPGTPKGIAVDNDGCPVPIPEKLTMKLLVEFDFNKAVIHPQFHGELEKFANFMIAYPQTKTVIEAHTDNIGSERYNLKLSQRRAESVIKYLADKFGIDRTRLSAKGYGFSKPVADNKTAAGRQRNRRVEAQISTTVTK